MKNGDIEQKAKIAIDDWSGILVYRFICTQAGLPQIPEEKFPPLTSIHGDRLYSALREYLENTISKHLEKFLNDLVKKLDSLSDKKVRYYAEQLIDTLSLEKGLTSLAQYISWRKTFLSTIQYEKLIGKLSKEPNLLDRLLSQNEQKQVWSLLQKDEVQKVEEYLKSLLRKKGIPRFLKCWPRIKSAIKKDIEKPSKKKSSSKSLLIKKACNFLTWTIIQDIMEKIRREPDLLNFLNKLIRPEVEAVFGYKEYLHAWAKDANEPTRLLINEIAPIVEAKRVKSGLKIKGPHFKDKGSLQRPHDDEPQLIDIGLVKGLRRLAEKRVEDIFKYAPTGGLRSYLIKTADSTLTDEIRKGKKTPFHIPIEEVKETDIVGVREQFNLKKTVVEDLAREMKSEANLTPTEQLIADNYGKSDEELKNIIERESGKKTNINAVKQCKHRMIEKLKKVADQKDYRKNIADLLS